MIRRQQGSFCAAGGCLSSRLQGLPTETLRFRETAGQPARHHNVDLERNPPPPTPKNLKRISISRKLISSSSARDMYKTTISLPPKFRPDGYCVRRVSQNVLIQGQSKFHPIRPMQFFIIAVKALDYWTSRETWSATAVMMELRAQGNSMSVVAQNASTETAARIEWDEHIELVGADHSNYSPLVIGFQPINNQPTIPVSPVRGGGCGGTDEDVQLLENRRKIAGKSLANRLRPLVVLVRIPGRQGESS